MQAWVGIAATGSHDGAGGTAWPTFANDSLFFLDEGAKGGPACEGTVK